MRVKLRRSSMILVLAGLLIGAPAATAIAGPVPDPVTIGPDEFFSGLVNGSNGISSPAPIMTNCVGAIQPGQTGNPLPGQSVEVELASSPVSSNDGYTGSAHAITAFLSWTSAATPELVATFSSYYVPEAIPVTLTVPCGGPGVMSFVPTPANTAGHTATVRVTFLSQP